MYIHLCNYEQLTTTPAMTTRAPLSTEGSTILESTHENYRVNMCVKPRYHWCAWQVNNGKLFTLSGNRIGYFLCVALLWTKREEHNVTISTYKLNTISIETPKGGRDLQIKCIVYSTIKYYNTFTQYICYQFNTLLIPHY